MELGMREREKKNKIKDETFLSFPSAGRWLGGRTLFIFLIMNKYFSRKEGKKRTEIILR